MASSSPHLLLLLLLLWAWCVTQSHMGVMARRLPSVQQDIELEHQFKLLNKPAVATISTIYGEQYDCVDFYEQPTFDHPALKNHSFHPKMVVDQQFGALWVNGKGCPLGSIPIKRTIKDDLIKVKLATEIYGGNNYKPQTAQDPGTHYAILHTKDGTKKRFNGAGMFSTIYNPLPVSGTQYSSSYLKLMNGQDSIEFGWTVNPTLYNDSRAHSYIFTNTPTTRCFNLYCSGFVSVRSDLPIDNVFPKVSIRGSGRCEAEVLTIYRDSASSVWWLADGHDLTQIGFWPQTIFNGLNDMATYVEWGGKVYSPPNMPSPPMGAGEKLTGDTVFDAFCSQLTTIDESHVIVDASDTSTYADISQYQVIDLGFIKSKFRRTLLFGGHGGYIGN